MTRVEPARLDERARITILTGLEALGYDVRERSRHQLNVRGGEDRHQTLQTIKQRLRSCEWEVVDVSDKTIAIRLREGGATTRVTTLMDPRDPEGDFRVQIESEMIGPGEEGLF